MIIHSFWTLLESTHLLAWEGIRAVLEKEQAHIFDYWLCPQESGRSVHRADMSEPGPLGRFGALIGRLFCDADIFRQSSELVPTDENGCRRARLEWDARAAVEGIPAQLLPLRATESSATEEFRIVVDKTTGQDLGVRWELKIEAMTGGLVQQWNATHPSLAVMLGDRIVEVNGIRNDVLQLFGELNQNTTLELVVKRYQEFKIVIDKTAGQDLGVQWELGIEAVLAGGLVQQWNETYPSLVVKPGGRIVEVNGIRNDLFQLSVELNQNKKLEVVVKQQSVVYM